MAGATTRWLIDKSALVKLPLCTRRDYWNQQIEASLVHLSFTSALEVGYSARNGQDHRELFTTVPLTHMPLVHTGDAAESRALEVQGLLAGRGHHRAPSIPDLLVAATAEKAPKPVLTGPLPINTCSVDSLTLLPGVGPVLAARIQEVRAEGYIFTTEHDLRMVKGIGPALSARRAPP